MLRSMTGFGAAAGSVEAVCYSIELRSVNNRYFKAIMKLPEVWSSVQTEIESLLRDRLHRGTVTLSVWMKLPDEQAVHNVNTVALNSYLDQLRTLETEANPILRLDIGSLLQLPGVCQPPPIEELTEQTRNGFIELVTSATDELGKMREYEGQALYDDLMGNCDVIVGRLSQVVDRAPLVVQEYQERLSARVNELIAAVNVEITEEQLAREAVLFAERSDVAEEISRLGTHVEQFRRVASSDEPVGRKLDFIAQEMLREANTIASKGNDTEIANAVVEIKTAIDRIKEQVQNVV